MPALVPELSAMAIEPQTPVSSLLRRSLVAASRLGVSDVVSWMTSELNGYSSAPLPEYRRIRGQLICEREYGGWMTLEVKSADILEMVSLRPVFNAIPELEALTISGQSLVMFSRPRARNGYGPR